MKAAKAIDWQSHLTYHIQKTKTGGPLQRHGNVLRQQVGSKDDSENRVNNHVSKRLPSLHESQSKLSNAAFVKLQQNGREKGTVLKQAANNPCWS